jgi:preprotein translocase subunit SecG
MIILFLILIVLASAILGFIILVQNPKGGGLSGSIAGINNQFMGVKQTNDVLEKGTWIFSIAIALLCVFSTFFMSGSTGGNDNDILNKINTNQGTTPAR